MQEEHIENSSVESEESDQKDPKLTESESLDNNKQEDSENSEQKDLENIEREDAGNNEQESLDSGANNIDMEFHKLWDVDISKLKDFVPSISDKIFSLEDVSHKYLLIGAENKTEIVEADSVDEALKKSSIQNVEKVYHAQHVKDGLIEDSSLLKSDKSEETKEEKI